MAITSVHCSWQLDLNSDLGLSGSSLPSVLNAASASMTLIDPRRAARKNGGGGQGIVCCGSSGHGFKKETIADHGDKEWL